MFNPERMILSNDDKKAIEILNGFLPDKIFDTHAHIYDLHLMPHSNPKNYDLNAKGMTEYLDEVAPLLSNPKTLFVNLIPFPDYDMKNLHGKYYKGFDAFLVDELTKHENTVGEIMVHPDETADDIKKRLVHDRIRGLKCYHESAAREDTFNAAIGEYLPEGAWQVADELNLPITLHMVKEEALANKENLDYILSMTKKYPNAILILAHAARSFAPWTAIENIDKIAHIENIWFDFSAVCESPAMFQILKKAGVSRCTWGSDFPVCRPHGKVVSIGDSFYWIYQRDIDHFISNTPVRNWLYGIENLMAVRQACMMADLSESEIEALFYTNATHLFKMNS